MEVLTNRVGLVYVAVGLLTGCGSSVFFDRHKTHQGPPALLDSKSFEAIDLAKLLDSDEENIEVAFNNLYSDIYEEDDLNKRRLRRNRVQDRIIAASNQRCGEYKIFVRQFNKNANFFLGLLTTLSAGAGTIFTDEGTVRALTGSTTILSGTQSRFNEVFFEQNTIQLLTIGFESRRKKILIEINALQKAEIHDYTVERAVGDAIRYHDACSINVGLEELTISQAQSDLANGERDVPLGERDSESESNGDSEQDTATASQANSDEANGEPDVPLGEEDSASASNEDSGQDPATAPAVDSQGADD